MLRNIWNRTFTAERPVKSVGSEIVRGRNSKWDNSETIAHGNTGSQRNWWRMPVTYFYLRTFRLSQFLGHWNLQYLSRNRSPRFAKMTDFAWTKLWISKAALSLIKKILLTKFSWTVRIALRFQIGDSQIAACNAPPCNWSFLIIYKN